MPIETLAYQWALLIFTNLACALQDIGDGQIKRIQNRLEVGGINFMKLKRYVIELGMGSDLHGQDVTKAAQRAVKDAISRSCLCGLVEIFEIKDLNNMYVHVKVAAPYPENVDKNRVLDAIPFGNKTIEVMKGGMVVPGLFIPDLGDSADTIVTVNAAVEVSIDVNSLKI